MASAAGRHLSKPVIGVTGNHKRFSPSWICIGLAVRLAGGLPRRISVRHRVDNDALDGLIISGGDDIHPSIYRAEPNPKAHYDPERDELERGYIGLALERNLPVLGICRGYQLLNAHCGGTLYPDIRPLRKQTSNRSTVLPRKTAILEATSRVAGVLRSTRLRINSLHHQAVKDPAENFTVVARDLDGFAQAMEHNDGRDMLGVQWHPEYLSYRAIHRRLFRWLVDAARQGMATES